MITYWILNDPKQRVYRHEVMKIIKAKNIDGFTIKEQQQRFKIAKYLENIIGNYINPAMMTKIGQKLEEMEGVADMRAQEIGKAICMFSIDAINEGCILENIDGLWIAANEKNRFIKRIQAISGMDNTLSW
eukprot:1134542_1